MNSSEFIIATGINLFLYVLFLGIALWFKFFPPKGISLWYGYRTPRSMKNEANWNYANNFSTSLLLWVPHLFLLCLIPLYLFGRSLPFMFFSPISTAISVFLFIAVIPITEYKLKQFEKSNAE
ncbi:MAG TPA: SdpI family protein [Cytophagaceae bacterium]|jgi:uncharacterized membrane protein|nr:SdpI family protein [Cytophagaceae bacterium]